MPAVFRGRDQLHSFESKLYFSAQHFSVLSFCIAHKLPALPLSFGGALRL